MNRERLLVGPPRSEGPKHRLNVDVEEPPAVYRKSLEAYTAEIDAAAHRGDAFYSPDFAAGVRHGIEMAEAYAADAKRGTPDDKSPADWELELLIGMEQVPNAAAIVLALRRFAELSGLTVQELLG